MTTTVVLPMFPLGSVLFPGGPLPLHIFETRYQQLLNHALESDRRFGVVLIERGHEVGGGDQRSSVGTVAEIQEHQRFDDGRAAVVSVGQERLEVIDWLDDAPYPRARVRLLPTEPIQTQDQPLFDAASTQFEEVVALGQRLGRLESAPGIDWDPDLETATWQLAARLPCTALDQYAILAAGTRAERLTKIGSLLADVAADLKLMGPLNG